jgi:hypothetical protein
MAKYVAIRTGWNDVEVEFHAARLKGVRRVCQCPLESDGTYDEDELVAFRIGRQASIIHINCGLPIRPERPA